jgi:hypothetical protein
VVFLKPALRSVSSLSLSVAHSPNERMKEAKPPIARIKDTVFHSEVYEPAEVHTTPLSPPPSQSHPTFFPLF